MKKLSILIFCVFVSVGYSQKKPNKLKNSNMSLVEVMVAAGISSSTSTFSNNSYAEKGTFFELSGAYYFSKFGLGASIGRFSNSTEENLLDFSNNATFPSKINSEKWNTSYYGIGPSYKTSFGNLEATIFGRAGIISVKPISLESNFTSENTDLSTTIPVYNFSTKETSKTGFYNAGIRLGYKLNSNLKLHITANYLSSFSDKIVAQDGQKQFEDINRDGIITEVDIIEQQDEIEFQYTKKNIQPQVFNYGIGLSYSFGSKKTEVNNQPKAQDHNASRSNTTSSKVAPNPDTNEEGDNKPKAQDHNASRSNTTSSKVAPNPDTNEEGDNRPKAQDHNASRSNTTSSKVAPNPDTNEEGDNKPKAQDHNASRSNTTSSKVAPNPDTNEEGDNKPKAQDHNASRSNTTSSKVAPNPNEKNKRKAKRKELRKTKAINRKNARKNKN